MNTEMAKVEMMNLRLVRAGLFQFRAYYSPQKREYVLKTMDSPPSIRGSYKELSLILGEKALSSAQLKAELALFPGMREEKARKVREIITRIEMREK